MTPTRQFNTTEFLNDPLIVEIIKWVTEVIVKVTIKVLEKKQFVVNEKSLGGKW